MGIDSDTVYFQTGTIEAGNLAIRSCPKDGSGGPTLLTAASDVVIEFVGSGLALYYREQSPDATGNAIKLVAAAGGNPITLASSIGSFGNNHSLVVSGDSVYLAGGIVTGTNSSFGRLLKLARDGSSFEVLINDEPVTALAVVVDSVYFGGTEDSDADPEPAAIHRIPK